MNGQFIPSVEVKVRILFIYPRLSAAARAWPALLVLFLSLNTRAVEKLDPAGIEFFEAKIRPILVEQCYKCHGEKSEKIRGGLLLDSKAGVLKGGDNGPAIVPGAPEKSLLIKAVRYTDDDLQMPPKGKKLAPDQVQALEAWVKMGAPDPRTGATAALASADKTASHWAYQPVRTPPVPNPEPAAWIQNPIDAFVLAKLDEKKLKPSPKADKRSLIRRAYFDLIGLPPTPDEVAAFEKDSSLDAFARVVDHLLSLPQYGERWGRHWLDVARYADTKGYVFEEERRFPFSFTYRDYVVGALNRDLPYDEFLVEQIAADELDLGKDKQALAAMGFLTLGRRFLNNEADIVDDRIDVVSRGLMGMTMTCARCHDHKFDPIPTADYYSLYGVFASSHEPAERPLLGSFPKEYAQYKAEKEKRERAYSEFKDKKENEALAELRSRAGEYMLAAYDIRHLDDPKGEQLSRSRKLDPGVVRHWKQKLEAPEAAQDPVLSPWVRLTAADEKDFAARMPEAIAKLEGQTNPAAGPNELLVRAIKEKKPQSAKELSEIYGRLLGQADDSWVSARHTLGEIKALPNSSLESLRQLLYADGAPANLPRGEAGRLLDVPSAQKIRALRRESEELDATHPGTPPRGMVLVEDRNPYQPHIFKRGNPGNQGPEVPRQLPAVLAGPNRRPFQKGSGRLEFARAVASKDNPLTARVFVNRVWSLHCGSPLVRTPSDFGLRAEPPSNPALLEFLAARFMDDGWSIKKLHRLIMLSSVYQQSSEENDENAKLDPNNEFYWRMNRQRLDFEGLRDTLLAVSHRLDLSEGGRPVDITDDPNATRRTIYGFIDRQNLPGLLRTFDFANPDASSALRYNTTVPQQALFMMNSPFVVLQARTLEESIPSSARSNEDKVQWLYQQLYQRPATPGELRLAESFLKKIDEEPPLAEKCWNYGYGEFSAAENKIIQFEPLPHYASENWRGGEKMPDPSLGSLTLNSKGGRPGPGRRHDAIRRWIAPADGAIRIEGWLKHGAEEGDGVRARVVSSREGLLSEWDVHRQEVSTDIEAISVQKGDTIDFAIDALGSDDHDNFLWAPRVEYIAGPGTKASAVTHGWDAARDFSGPAMQQSRPLDAWGKYTQVLLLSNEFVFVD